MNYKLAKELKDAGLEQIPNPSPEQGFWMSEGVGTLGEAVFVPTLQYLIDACGDGFMALNQKLHVEVYHSWYAVGSKDGSETFTCFGETPLEAVAELYKALKKKT